MSYDGEGVLKTTFDIVHETTNWRVPCVQIHVKSPTLFLVRLETKDSTRVSVLCRIP